MAGSKWISDLTAATSLAKAAEHVVKVRLGAVGELLPLALHEAGDDPEHVHQLRVATRRARAALGIFSSCLPDKVFKKAKKTLRVIRRGAGDARDWDVFLAALTEPGQAFVRGHRPGVDFLVGYALGQRRAAQDHLESATRDYPQHFARFLADTLAGIRQPRDSEMATLADMARLQIAGLIRELSLAGAAGFDDYAHLHQIRISGKRLRYAMEVFVDCFPEAFRTELYPPVEEMQEILGQANDSHVAIGRLEALKSRLQATLPKEWKRFKPGIEGLLRFHAERLPRKRDRFVEWWENWQRSGSQKIADIIAASVKEDVPAPAEPPD